MVTWYRAAAAADAAAERPARQVAEHAVAGAVVGGADVGQRDIQPGLGGVQGVAAVRRTSASCSPG